ncbi:MAG: DUF1638 domain-containing protein [Gammaproteobacteria bacterium]|nr:DUF1638 domain-containing protein [Gammaproteobacteria bacterium]
MPMDAVLVIACGALAHDLVRVKNLNQWDHLEIQCLPAELHNEPQKIPDAIRLKVNENRGKYRDILIGYSDCGTGGLLDAVIQEEGLERLPGAHCYEMFTGEAGFKKLHEAEPGTFYLTDFLARHFDRLVIKGLGLDRFPELKDTYFTHYRKLVFLAQLNDEEVDRKAKEAADFLGLEYVRIETGDQFLESALSVKIGTLR